jgi:hypothetical protein
MLAGACPAGLQRLAAERHGGRILPRVGLVLRGFAGRFVYELFRKLVRVVRSSV